MKVLAPTIAVIMIALVMIAFGMAIAHADAATSPFPHLPIERLTSGL